MVVGPSETGATCFGGMFTPLSSLPRATLHPSPVKLTDPQATYNSLGGPANIRKWNLSLFVGPLYPGDRLGSQGASQHVL